MSERESATTNSDSKASRVTEKTDNTFKDGTIGVTWTENDYRSNQKPTDNTVGREDKIGEIWEQTLRSWGVSANAENKKMFKREVLIFFALNGTSPYLADQTMTIGNKEYPIEPLVAACGGKKMTLRQFCRAQSETTSQILAHNPDIARECARRNGYPAHMGIWAFDFNDKCNNNGGRYSELGRLSEDVKGERLGKVDRPGPSFARGAQTSERPVIRSAPTSRFGA
jgi:hypothetical protein